jgi:hypothetical protein
MEPYFIRRPWFLQLLSVLKMIGDVDAQRKSWERPDRRWRRDDIPDAEELMGMLLDDLDVGLYVDAGECVPTVEVYQVCTGPVFLRHLALLSHAASLGSWVWV